MPSFFGHQNDVIKDFFLLTDEQGMQIHEEIHHMLTEFESGWTFRDLYFMPVLMRKWYFVKYNERIARFNKSNSDD